eukprot:COSAG05_NODE_702_length_7857_cov_37.135244_9_plen_116_part_00
MYVHSSCRCAADTKLMFKGLDNEDGDDLDLSEVFPTEQLFEGPLSLASKESSRRQSQRWVVLYEDKLAWWKAKAQKDRGKQPDGFYEMRDLLQAENTKHHNFRYHTVGDSLEFRV